MIKPLSIEVISTKYLVGKRINMSLTDDKTGPLWQEFMSKHQHITHTINSNLYSVEYFPCTLQAFTPNTLFEKWAAVEVSKFTEIPNGLEKMIIETGLYAIFIHRGPAKTFPQTLKAILTQWLPQSGYQYDRRSQFEVMSADYRPDDLYAQEAIWIPIIK